MNKRILLFSLVIFTICFTVVASTKAGYNWKSYFSFGEMTAVKKVVNDSVENQVSHSDNWKGLISTRNIKDGSITADKLASGVISGSNVNPDFGSLNVTTKGTGNFGTLYTHSGDGAIYAGTFDTMGPYMFIGKNSLNSISISSQHNMFAGHTEIVQGDFQVSQGSSAFKDVVVRGDAAIIGGDLSVDGNGILNGNFTLDSSEGTQRYITDSNNNIQIGDGVNDVIKLKGAVDLSGASSVKLPAATIGGTCSVSGSIGTNPSGNAGERIMVCDGSHWIAN